MSSPNTQYQPSNAQQAYVPTTITLPEDPAQQKRVLVDYLSRVANSLNVRDIGEYSTTEVVTGQNYYGTSATPLKQRGVFRKVIDYSLALPNTASVNIPHGLTLSADFRFTRIYGVANNPGTSAIPLPNDGAGGQGVALSISGANIVLTTAFNATAFTSTSIVLEYVKS